MIFDDDDDDVILIFHRFEETLESSKFHYVPLFIKQT